MGNGGPPDFKLLTEQILAYTKIDVNPKNPKPGERMTVETIPGILPFIPADLAGQFNLPVTGPVEVLLEALVKAVNFSVKYKVTVDGTETSSVTWEPLTPMSLPDSDPLMALLRIAPPLIPEFKANTPPKVELTATVKVDVEGNVLEKDVKVPLDLVAIPIPALLVLTGNGKVFVMGRAGGVADISGAVNTINSAVQALNAVKDLLNFGLAFDVLLGDLADTASMIASGGPVGFAVEEAPDLDDYSDFDDEPDEALLIGPIGTEVRFYSGEDYNDLALGDDEVTRFRLDTDIGAPFSVTTGFGFIKETGWQTTRMWDTDPDDEMDDVKSCRFFDAGDPLHPGDSDLP